MNSIGEVSSVSNSQDNWKITMNAIESATKSHIEDDLKSEDKSVQDAGASDPDQKDDVTYSDANQN
jgi:hypothetical protein